MLFFLSFDKIPGKSNFRKEGFVLVHFEQMSSTVAGIKWWQGCGWLVPFIPMSGSRTMGMMVLSHSLLLSL